MLINRDELKAQMIRKHVTRDELSKLLCVSLRTLNDKIIGNRDFKESEICALISLFGNSIFFDLQMSVFRTKKGGKRSDN